MADAQKPGVTVDLLDALEPLDGLEPDPVVVDEANDRDWHLEHQACQARDAIERAVRRCVEYAVTANRG
jgi:hypothetical protein